MRSERIGSRLQVRLAGWMLVAGIVPLLIVGGIVYVVLLYQHMLSLQHELSVASRFKENQFTSFIESRAQIVSSVAQEANQNIGINDKEIVRLLNERITRELGSDEAARSYVVRSDQVISGTASSTVSVETLPSLAELKELRVGIRNDLLYIGKSVPDGNGAIVMTVPIEQIKGLMYSGINDARYYTSKHPFDQEFGLGSTADITVLDQWDTPVVPSLMDRTIHLADLPQRMKSTEVSYAFSDVAVIDGQRTIMHVHSFPIAGSLYTLVLTVDRTEFMSRWIDQQRGLIALYLIATMLVFIVLFVFVASTQTTIIKPVQNSVQSLVGLMGRFREAIDASQQGVDRETDLAKVLERRSREQLENIATIEREVRGITEGVVQTTTNSSLLAKNAKVIGALATSSETNALDAEKSIESMKRSSTTSQALMATLEQYAHEVTTITATVRSIGEALQFFTVNATIQASKVNADPKLKGLVTEVHKLSQIASSASDSIQLTVQRMERPLRETLRGATDDVRRAEQGLATVTEAAANLKRMSRSTIAMVESIASIDVALEDQRGRTIQVRDRMKQIGLTAHSNLEQSSQVLKLVDALRVVITESSDAVRKVEKTVSELRSLLGGRST